MEDMVQWLSKYKGYPRWQIENFYLLRTRGKLKLRWTHTLAHKLYHDYTCDAANVGGILVAGLDWASTVVNNWGIDMPPDITISVSHKNVHVKTIMRREIIIIK